MVTLALTVAVLLVMAAFTLGLGSYLVATNPPKDRRKFVGLGAEKLPDAEFEE